jgi:hypothetical protein
MECVGSSVGQRRKFNLGAHVRVEGQASFIGRVFGYEYSDGKNVCGRPFRRYRGWFYHVRKEGSGDESIVPENQLSLRVLSSHS